jgi:hypothetical protein
LTRDSVSRSLLDGRSADDMVEVDHLARALEVDHRRSVVGLDGSVPSRLRPTGGDVSGAKVVAPNKANLAPRTADRMRSRAAAIARVSISPGV